MCLVRPASCNRGVLFKGTVTSVQLALTLFCYPSADASPIYYCQQSKSRRPFCDVLAAFVLRFTTSYKTSRGRGGCWRANHAVAGNGRGNRYTTCSNCVDIGALTLLLGGYNINMKQAPGTGGPSSTSQTVSTSPPSPYLLPDLRP